MKLSSNVKALLIITLIAIIATAGIAYAVNYVYVLQKSNTINPTISTGQQTVNVPVTLTMSPPSPTDLDTITLTATVASAYTTNVNGYTMNFYDGAVNIGHAVISGGSASIQVGPYTAGSTHSLSAGA